MKIDEQGNVSDVMLTCTDESNSKERTDIRVVPSEIRSLSGAYTYLVNCSFYNGYQQVWFQQYETRPSEFNILVRNRDGKIFYVPSSAHEYFIDIHNGNRETTKLGKNNELYISNGSKLAVVMTNGDETVIRQLSPK